MLVPTPQSPPQEAYASDSRRLYTLPTPTPPPPLLSLKPAVHANRNHAPSATTTKNTKMLKEEVVSGSSSGGNNWPRFCDKCHSAPSTVYCQADSAYLCTDCNARVWLCEACERMPAKFLCKADAASLCASCDAEIHSANPLAHRHQRVPINPVAGCIYGPTTATDEGARLLKTRDGTDSLLAAEGDHETRFSKEDEDEAASWLLLNPAVKNDINMNVLDGDVDEYLDLDEYNSGTGNTQFSHEIRYNQQQGNSILLQKSYGRGDIDGGVVPVQSAETKYQLRNQQLLNIRVGMDYETNPAYSYNASISGSDSVSSLDACTIQGSPTLSDMTMAHSRSTKGTTVDHPSPNPPTQLSPMDREARVMRYREKKKRRKFEKKIRYASRKAYAETRPRIKGRFAKRSDLEVVGMEQKFSNNNNNNNNNLLQGRKCIWDCAF